MPEKDITSVIIKTDMRKKNVAPKNLVLEVRALEKRVNALDKRVRQLQNDPDDVLTKEDLKAIRKAKEEFRTGKTVRIA